MNLVADAKRAFEIQYETAKQFKFERVPLSQRGQRLSLPGHDCASQYSNIGWVIHPFVLALGFPNRT